MGRHMYCVWGTLKDRHKPASDLVVGRITLPHKDCRGYCVPEGRRARILTGCFRHMEGKFHSGSLRGQEAETPTLVVGVVVVE